MKENEDTAASPGLTRPMADPQEYTITHPQAIVNGILKGSYYGTISDQISVTCRGPEGQKTRLRTVLDYKDEVGSALYTRLPGTCRLNPSRALAPVNMADVRSLSPFQTYRIAVRP